MKYNKNTESASTQSKIISDQTVVDFKLFVRTRLYLNCLNFLHETLFKTSFSISFISICFFL